jgi:hypothetical protein
MTKSSHGLRSAVAVLGCICCALVITVNKLCFEAPVLPMTGPSLPKAYEPGEEYQLSEEQIRALEILGDKGDRNALTTLSVHYLIFGPYESLLKVEHRLSELGDKNAKELLQTL